MGASGRIPASEVRARVSGRGARAEIANQWETIAATLYGEDELGVVCARPVWIAAGERALDRVGLPHADAEDLVQETAAYLERWLAAEGPLPDLHPARLINHTMQKRARGRLVRTRGRVPQPGGRKGEPLSLDALVDVPGFHEPIAQPVDHAGSFLGLDARRSVTARLHRGEVTPEEAQAILYCLWRISDEVPLQPWMSEAPRGGTNDADRLAWETLEYLEGEALPRNASSRQRKRRKWVLLRDSLRRHFGEVLGRAGADGWKGHTDRSPRSKGRGTGQPSLPQTHRGGQRE